MVLVVVVTVVVMVVVVMVVVVVIMVLQRSSTRLGFLGSFRGSLGGVKVEGGIRVVCRSVH